jgi:glutamyl-Q tRNA(Asp) synthetase
MEDLDRSREVPGAADRILRTLEIFGFEWDGQVEYQSRRTPLYAAAIERLRQAGLIYPCSCSRSDLARLARTSDGEAVYPGSCRSGPGRPGVAMAWRFRVGQPGKPVTFDDRLQGAFSQDVAVEVGDFVARRRDGCHAYQLAVVVDDADQRVSDVVRGCDLLDNTPRQILLQRALGLPMPGYCHLPVVTEPDGSKLAKRARSVPLDASRAPQQLHEVLRLLQQSPPEELRSASVTNLWSWAIENWDPERLRAVSRVCPAA